MMGFPCSPDVYTKNAYRILMCKYFGKRQLGRQRTLNVNVKMCVRVIGCEDGKWMELKITDFWDAISPDDGGSKHL
jgi:hypothetical protein